MLSRANRKKLNGFKQQLVKQDKRKDKKKNKKREIRFYNIRAIKDYHNYLPERMNTVLFKLYLGKHVELSKDSNWLKQQKELLALNLITIKGDNELALTKQGQALCKVSFTDKSKIDLQGKIHKFLYALMFLCVIVFITFTVTGINTGVTLTSIRFVTHSHLSNLMMLISIIVTIISLVADIIISSTVDTKIHIHVTLSDLKNNLEHFYKGDEQKEYHKFLKEIEKHSKIYKQEVK